MGATGHLRHPLAEQVGGHEGGGQPVVGGPVAQLAVAIVTPSKHLSIYEAAGKHSLSEVKVLVGQMRNLISLQSIQTFTKDLA